MNLLEFHSRLSSPINERVLQFPENLMIYTMLNGAAINENELTKITHEGNKVRLTFVSVDAAKIAEDKIAAQVVPGICGGPLYGIVAIQEQESLVVEFVEL